MDVFLSWAGTSSNTLASLLREFLPIVVQECSPWMSAHDILAGQPWDPEIEAALKRAKFGVLCVTPENLGSTYLHYEAGAIANQVGSQNRVCPVLLGGLTAPQLGQPLGRFQGKAADEVGIWALVQSLNSIAERPLETPRLKKSFDGQWPELEAAIAAIPRGNTAPSRRPPEELLDEILQHVRIFSAGSLGERRASGQANSTPRSKSPECQIRDYAGNLEARIYRTLMGTFQWSVEDTKNKVVIADGEAATLPEARTDADAAASSAPLGPWQVTRK